MRDFHDDVEELELPEGDVDWPVAIFYLVVIAATVAFWAWGIRLLLIVASRWAS